MDYLLKTDENYPFNQLKLHSPQPIQGGTYLAKISRSGNPVLFQTPKCNTKRGIHKTEKKIYCDLLFDTDNVEFIEWLNTIEEHIQKLIYEKKDLWFVEGEVSMEDIEYNWIDTVKNYKKSHLLRTFIPKINKQTYNTIQVYDDNQNLLSIDDIKENSSLISIIELSALKFSSSSFHLEFVLRQAMIIKDKPVFNKCLITLDSNKTLEKVEKPEEPIKEEETVMVPKEKIEEPKEETPIIKVETQVETQVENKLDNVEKLSVSDGNEEEEEEEEEEGDDGSSDEESEEEDEEEEKEENTELLITKKENNSEEEVVINDNKIEKEANTLEKNDNILKLNEYKLELPKDSETMNLKTPNEVYLEVYKKAREKAKRAREEAIKAFLTLKKIKKQYLLDEIELSEDESDEEMELLFSEK
jgi:hypothetical protein